MKAIYTNTLILAFASVFLFSCKDTTEKTKPFIQDISESVYASGIIKSKNQYQITSTVNGIISDVYVKEGEMLKKDQPILSISNLPVELLKENAQLAANYNDYASNEGKLNELKMVTDVAKSKLQIDSLMYYRQKALWDQQVGTKVELEQRELAFKSSKSNYNSAIVKWADFKRQLNLLSEQAKNNLKINAKQASDYVIKSDMDGMLYELTKEKGELVTSQVRLGTIGDSKEFVIELQIDESDILKIKLNQKVIVSIESIKNEVFEATVSKITPYMNEKTKTFMIEASFIKQPPLLYPNNTLEANVIISSKEKATLIPRKFLLENDSVMLADGKKQKVKVGLMDFQNAEILDGITESNELILPKK